MVRDRLLSAKTDMTRNTWRNVTSRARAWLLGEATENRQPLAQELALPSWSRMLPELDLETGGRPVDTNVFLDEPRDEDRRRPEVRLHGMELSQPAG
jgi:hypothetical protein